MSDAWTESSLGEQIRLTKGVTYTSADYCSRGDGHAFLTIKCVEKGGGFSVDGLKYYKGAFQGDQILKQGDLVIALTDLTRAGDIVGGPILVPDFGSGTTALPSMDLAILRPTSPETNLSFIFYRLMLHDARRYMLAHAGGTTVLHLETRAVPKFKFMAPPPNDQAKIAKILSTVDEAIEHTKALISKTQQIKAGLMHDLFTRGVTPDGQLRPLREAAANFYKESPLGWIPKHWECRLLDEVAARGSGHTPSKNHPEYWGGPIKWISLADSSRLDRVYIDDTQQKITQAGVNNSSAVVHPAGIVVLSRDAGVGKSAITTDTMAVSQHFMCWRCGQHLNNHYLYYWLQYRKWEFENIATGSTIPTIGLRYFRHYRMSLPSSVSEQEKIAECLLGADRKAFALEAELGKLKQLRGGLMRDLLKGLVKVFCADAIRPVAVPSHAGVNQPCPATT